MSSTDAPSISTAPWWSKLMRPFWRDADRNPLQHQISLSLHQSLIGGADLADQLAALRTRSPWQLGVLRKRLWQFGIERATDLIYHQQAPVSTLSWGGGFTGSLGFRFREAVDDALMAIDEADRIGAETVVIAPGGQGNYSYRHARRFAIDGVQEIIAAAADRHLRLAVLVDFHALRSPRSMLHSWDAAAEFLDHVGSPHVGLAAPFPTLPKSASGHQPWEACAAKLFVATTPAEMVMSSSRLSPAVNVTDTAEVLDRLWNAGFRGTWEFAAPTGAPPWWNGREALLHCSSWVNNVAHQWRQVRAG